MSPKRYVPGKLYLLDLSDVAPDPDNPRKFIDQDALAELTASVKKHEVLEPIIVRGGNDGKFSIVAGERRYHASLAAGRTTIPAILTAGDPLEIALVENLLRQGYNPIEEAEAIEKLRINHDYQLSDLSQIVGLAESTICEILSLNKLPDDIKNECRKDPKASRNMLIKVARERKTGKMQALYEKYKERGLTSGDYRALPRVAMDPSEAAIIDLSFVERCRKRIEGMETERLDSSQAEAAVQVLEKLRSSAFQKIKSLKGQVQLHT